MLGAVIPLVRAGGAFIRKLVALALGKTAGALQLLRAAARRVPSQPAVIGALDDLAEPAAGLRCINAVGIRRRTFEVINLPARKMRPADLPVLPAAVRRQDERPFLGAGQYANGAHDRLLGWC